MNERLHDMISNGMLLEVIVSPKKKEIDHSHMKGSEKATTKNKTNKKTK